MSFEVDTNRVVLNISDGSLWRKAVINDSTYFGYFNKGERNLIKEYDIINVQEYEVDHNGTIVINKFLRPSSIQVGNVRIGSPVPSQCVQVRGKGEINEDYSFLFNDDFNDLLAEEDNITGRRPGVITQILAEQLETREIIIISSFIHFIISNLHDFSTIW